MKKESRVDGSAYELPAVDNTFIPAKFLANPKLTKEQFLKESKIRYLPCFPSQP
jgi:hypothetical protein